MKCESRERGAQAASGRPAGAIRTAIAQTFASQAGASFTCRDIVAALQAQGLVHAGSRSERAIVRRTVGNMLAAGELVTAGQRPVVGSKRPMVLYALALHQVQTGGGAMLADLMRSWPAMPAESNQQLPPAAGG